MCGCVVMTAPPVPTLIDCASLGAGASASAAAIAALQTRVMGIAAVARVTFAACRIVDTRRIEGEKPNPETGRKVGNLGRKLLRTGDKRAGGFGVRLK